jgi:ribosomal protein L14E/L6E/L27E
MKIQKTLIFLTFNFLTFNFIGQNTTVGGSNNKTEREAAAAHKVMLIPFESRLYMSEIDQSINAETKLTAKEIKYKFRDGLNEQLFKAFKTNKFNVVDLMEDTAKYRKDLNGIYQYLTYEFQKIPNQENYQPPKKEKEKKAIEKGQLNVESNSDARFMNAKITDAKVVPILYGKYKTDLFVFINQLDIKASGRKGPAELGEGNGNRKITVHYTVYTFDAKEINSGVAEEEFAVDLNNPKKIIEKHFSKIASTIVQRVNKGLAAPVK